MRKPKELDPSRGPVQWFAFELRMLRRAAANPTYRQMSVRGFCAFGTLARAARGERFPTWPVTRAFVIACGADVEEWNERWQAVAAQLDCRGPGPVRPGHSLAGVHSAVGKLAAVHE